MLDIELANRFNEMCEKSKLTPNECLTLLDLSGHLKIQFNNDLEKRLLFRKKYLDSDYKLTIFAKEIIPIKIGLQDFYSEFNDIFPKKLLPSGRYAKSNIADVKLRLQWFMSTYPYTQEEILNATKKYVEVFEGKNYQFMQTSAYFIRKSEIGKKMMSSALAEWCEMIKSNGEIDAKTYDINV
jgi:hypothetical protein